VGALLSSATAVTHGTLSSWLYEIVGISSVVAIALGIRIFRPKPSLPWWFILAGQSLWVIGDALWDFYPFLFGHELPYPSIADAAYVLAYPLLSVGLALFVRSRREAMSTAGRLDALVVAIAGAGLIWELALQFYSTKGSLLVDVFYLIYPVVDIVLLGILARLLFVPGRWTPSFLLLVTGFVVTLLCDVLYARVFTVGPWSIYPWLGIGWLTAYILTGAAALHPSMTQIAGAPTGRHEALTRTRMLTLAGVGASPLLAYIVTALLGVRQSALGVVLISLVVLGLAIARITGLIGALERQSDELARLHRERGLLLDEVTRAVEEERTRVAADLHDGPIQRLTALGLHAQRASHRLDRGDDSRETARILHQVAEGLGEEIAKLRRLMMELRPPALSERGLVDALQDYCRTLSAERRTEIEYRASISGRVPADAETALYRIAQEALTNAVKHSRAQRIRVSLEGIDHRVRLSVSDDGVGFDPATNQMRDDGRHFGLLAMRERATMLNGELTIQSAPGQGTTVVASIPRTVVPT